MPKAPIRDIEIAEEPIRLGQFLKLAGIAEDGGHARELLETEQVMLNGRLETRRGAQLRPGDVVAVGEQCARPILH
ncbi:RNA-binding S4 domain-containing protein [Pseudonocardia bannensis]|uniref:RNA-binding S4 domain-containing protein n=1 Tax=Pseudonocardia bannensis TaxID=630973 RepID=A0A848DM06_9PSEU|nr:RNA-binding S4 domain-containing protein [Pseudonocardia bannensis]NMH93414.1 RNA-binding S4 domain-containing protein [Pseudonocardia bannensis]